MFLLTLMQTAFFLAATGQTTTAFNADTRNLESAASTSGSSSNWSISKRFATSDCSGTPINFVASPGCAADTEGQCIAGDFVNSSNSSSSEVAIAYYELECVADATTALKNAYGDTPFLQIDFYADPKCSELQFVSMYVADGECHDHLWGTSLDDIVPASWLVTKHDNGSISELNFVDFGCAGNPTNSTLYDQGQLTAGECSDGKIVSTNLGQSSSSGSQSSTSGSDSSAGSSVMLATGCAALLALSFS